MRADRLLGILLALDQEKKVTARELAERFEVSVRTIYRDIDVLSLDYRITADTGPEGGYSLMAGYKIPSLPFTKKEAAALTLMGSVAGQKIGLIEGDVFQQAYNKLLSRLPKAKEGEPRPVASKILIDIEPWQVPKQMRGSLEKLTEALEKNLTVEFLYAYGKAKEARLKVEPHGLCFRRGCWHLVGRFPGAGDFRFFRVDRISRLNLTGKVFVPDPGFDLKGLWEEKVSVPYREKEKGAEARLIIEASAASAINFTGWPEGRLKTLEDGRVELSFRSLDISRLVGFALKWGPQAKLIAPALARAEVKRRLEEALKAYR